MNSEKIFELALGYNKGKSTVHDRTARSWRHLNFFEHECYLHCRIPRVKDVDNKVSQVQVPWARAGSGFTLLFEAYSMCLIEQEMPVNKAAKVVKEYPNRLWTIFNYWISIAYNDADHSEIAALGIDETSSKKGHDYLTVAMDLDNSRVVHVTPGKGADTITRIADYLETKGTPRDYHVKALLNKAMDTVRKTEYAMHRELKGHKYLFLKSNKKLSRRQRSERNNLLNLLPTIGEAYRLKVLFDDFWDMEDINESEGFLAYWCDLVYDSKIQPLIRFAKTVKLHWSGIVNCGKLKFNYPLYLA